MRTQWNSIPMTPKLIGLFLAVGLLPMILVSWLAGDHARVNLLADASNQLESIREIKKEQIQNYVDERWHDLHAVASISKIMRDEALKRLQSIKDNKKHEIERLFQTHRGQLHSAKDDPFIRHALVDFNKAFVDANHKVNSPEWKNVAEKYRPRLRDIVKDSYWPDLLLINTEGGIIFTARGGDELGKVIPESSLKHTSLGMAWRSIQSESRDEMVLSEFFPYPPAGNKHTAFMIAPVVDTQDDTLLGYITVPIGSKEMNTILQQHVGLEESGEPYLVGQVNGSTVYRSDRVAKEGRFGEKKSGVFINKALAGESGGEIKIGSTGLVELVHYAPLTIPGLKWAILVTVSAEDAITPKAKQNKTEDLFSQYSKEKRLSDLLLISPDGSIFYSVDEEADYQTSLIHGPYAQSHLGRLVRATLKSKAPGISDFAPYDPSGGAQTAFMVEPILTGNEIELLVALQLSHTDLDKILHKREGMGKTGETFLVGEQNGRLSYRNNRLLEKGKVGQTLPEHLAIVARETHKLSGMDTILDENKEEELVSHTQLEIPGLNWTLLATVHAQEVEAPIQRLLQEIAQVALGLAFLVILIAFLTARGITIPIHRLMTATQAIVDGNWSARVTVARSDEIGRLGTLFNQLAQFIEEQYWLQASLAQFAELIQKSASPKELAQQLISQLADVLEVGHGVVYVLEENGQRYKLLGSFGYSERKNLANIFAEGESLVGQCALENKSILLTNTPENYIKISSGLGEAKPLTILAVPIGFQDKVLAVVEIASFNPITRIQKTLIERLTQTIGLGLENQFRNQRTQKLLLETQTQSEALARQQEELRQNNEELQQQAQTLKASEEELQTQQEELQAANEQLREKTEYLQKNQSDLEMARTQIEEKAEALEQASRYKSEFLANMSHELRTPLNSMLILSKSFAENPEGNLTEEQREASQIIHGSGKDLLELINDILDLAKIESGRMDIHLNDIITHVWADDLQTQFGHVAKDKGLEWVVKVAKGVPEILRTDPMKMQQIIKNFLSNSFKFTKKGQVMVHIQPPPPDRRMAQNEYRIVGDGSQEKAIAIEVSDAGIGIPEDKLGLIFEAFQQADGGTSRQYGGTGLGLSISRELALLLGGEIRLQSTVGKGSTFTLLLPKTLDKSLPVRPFMPSPTTLPPSDILSSDRPPSDQEIKRRKMDLLPPIQPLAPPCPEDDRENIIPEDQLLLIIDDDPDFAALACRMSRAKRFKCLIATDGRSGLDLAVRYTPCGIIVASALPALNGIAVLTMLKEAPETRNIPVYMSSSEEPCREALQRGAVGHLKKPIEPKAFAELVRKIEYFSGSGKRRVLIVEDDTLSRQFTTELLRSSSVEIISVGSGEAAYALLQKQPFDCVILDLGLPGISGFELLERISKNEEIPNLPVIIYSGRALSREEHEKLTSLADSVVIKGTQSEERLVDEVTLFIHSRMDALSAKQRAMLQKVHDPQLQFEERQILLVDDDMRNAFALKRVLRLKGFNVFIAANGRKALTFLEEQPKIDVILMDIMMPDMNGYQAIQEIRKQVRFQQLPILAVSAKATVEDRKKCLDAGANDFIAKPVDTDRLLAMLRLWLYR